MALEGTAAGCLGRIGVMCLDSANGKMYFASCNNVAEYSTATGAMSLHACPSQVFSISLCGDFLLVGCESGDVLLLRARSLDTLAMYKIDSACHYSFSHDGYFIFAGTDGRVSLVSTHDGPPFVQRSIVNVKAPKRVTALGMAKYGDEPIILVAVSDLQLHLYTQRGDALLSASDHHTNWINRFGVDANDPRRFLTCGQDRVVRVWRIKEHSESRCAVRELVSAAHRFVFGGKALELDMTGVLVGHEDAVLSAIFPGSDTIISSSADRTIIRWAEREDVWESTLQVGDVAGIGTLGSGDLFDVAVDGQSILAHNTTGSIVRWDAPEHRPLPLLTGHYLCVEDVAFSPSGKYLLSASADRTTRAWAVAETRLVEIARPQVHGYELKGIAFVSEGCYVAAADEKVIRVFQATVPFGARLESLTAHCIDKGLLHVAGEAVAQPALGLSNKVQAGATADLGHRELLEPDLQTRTLFPEVDKLYGHGDELQCIASSLAGGTVASASRAHLAGDSTIRIWKVLQSGANAEHRLLHTVTPHGLTVTRLSFSPCSSYLLSVSRDRKLAVTDVAQGEVVWTVDNAHERILWDGCWLGSASFATGARDCTVKIWSFSERRLVSTATFDHAVTALAYSAEKALLIVGLESGHVHTLDPASLEKSLIRKANGRVRRLAVHASTLAIAAEDHSLSVLGIK